MAYASKAQAAAYLAGMIDGEGTIGQYNANRKVAISNTDYALIEACAEACDVLGIKYAIYPRNHPQPRCKAGWDLTIRGGRRSYEVLLRDVPIRSPNKRARLAAMLETYRRTRRPPRVDLEADYLAGMSYADLGRKYNCQISTIQGWMRQLGIPARSYSEATTLAWEARR